jgi:excisionase family DNA binding protein
MPGSASGANAPVDNLGGEAACGWHTGDVARRFIPLTEVSEILDISAAQAYALVRSGDLPAIKVGGRGQWRVETVELEAYIQRMYSETRELVTTRSDPDPGGDDGPGVPG